MTKYSAAPIPIKVRTEPLFSDQEHDVFFNRGVASSQAYTREFKNKSPEQLDKTDKKEGDRAREWLSRKLDDAILKFIANARKGDTLLCCFYEFRYLPVAKALKEALVRGVDVQLLIDGKVNEILGALMLTSQGAVAEAKRLVRDLTARKIDDALVADTAQRIADIRISQDGREGVRSFLDKRKPRWVVEYEAMNETDDDSVQE